MTNDTTSRKFYQKKKFIIPAILILGLIVFRIYLPTLVKNYVNDVLANDIPDYFGHVEDIDIAIIRGAYVLNGFYLNKVDATTQVPFLNFPKIDISVEWGSLFKGKIVSEVYMYNPEVIYVLEDMSTSDESTEEDWTQALKDIVPLSINHFEVVNGKMAFVQVNADPTIDLQLNGLNFTADNLRNVEAEKHTLPSPVFAEATSIGNGKLSVNGNVNLLKEIPDMDLSVKLENIEVEALNDFADHYGKLDFEDGDLGMFTEIAIADGFLKGYFKVLLEDAKFIGKEDNFLEKVWEGFVSFFEYVLSNKDTDTLALKAPVEGDLNNVETSIWPIIGSIFKNAFVSAVKGEVDDEIEYQDAIVEKNEEEEKKLKWWQFKKKKERKERKEQEQQEDELANNDEDDNSNGE